MAMKNETNQNNVITEFKKTKTKNEKTKQKTSISFENKT